MDRLENSLTDIRDDIGVNTASAVRAPDAVDGTRLELRTLSQEVTTMHRQIKRLEERVREITGDP